ncbi:hypothetical protein [Pseudomonas huanghezhanensis]|nr:hypothetical protein [Pseudomonas sp. BSw22131]
MSVCKEIICAGITPVVSTLMIDRITETPGNHHGSAYFFWPTLDIH